MIRRPISLRPLVVALGALVAVVVPLQGASAHPAQASPPASTGAVETDPVVPYVDGATFVPVTPCRVADSRVGPRWGANERRTLRVGGTDLDLQGGEAAGCGVPADALAAELSISVVDPTDGGFLRAWPTGEAAPNASFSNFRAGTSDTNTGSLALGDDAALDVRNHATRGQLDVVIDVQGYYVVPDELSAATYRAITPCRAVDTRRAGGVAWPREIREVQIAGTGPAFAAQGGTVGGCGIPEGAQAVEVALSAVDPFGSGFLRAWPADQPFPDASVLNFARGQGITNTASIRLGATAPDLKLRGFGSPTHLVVDVVGYWMDEELNGAVGGLFHPMLPCRTVDTRQATGGALRERSSRQLSLVGRDLGAQGGSGAGCAIPAESLAVEAAVSAVAPRGDGFLRAWPAYAGEPTATIVNFRDGESATNTGALPREVGLGRDVVARAYGSTTDLVLDATGYFLPPGQTVLVTSDRSDDVRLRPTADGRTLFFDGDPRGPEPGVHRWQDGAGSQLVLDQEVWHPVPSADGSVVAVNAKGSDLDPPMEGEGADLWTFDPADGLLDREVTLPDFEWSGVVALSGDASTLVFQTEASDLVAGDDEASRDLFLLDRSDGTISSPTLDADLDLSWANTISHDGTVVAFTAKASGQEWAAAYVWSASTGLSTRISPEGVDARFADVSADGTTVVYAGASNGSTATIRSYGIATGVTTEISDAATSSFQPTVSGDGRYIAYVQNSEVVETRPGTSQPWWYWSARRVIRVFDVAAGATVTAVAGDFDSVSPAIASAGDHIFVQQGPPEGPGPVGIYRWQRPST